MPCIFRYEITEACVKSSDLFSVNSALNLTEHMRLTALMQDHGTDREALEFPEFLLHVGDQRVPETTVDYILLPISTSDKV